MAEGGRSRTPRRQHATGPADAENAGSAGEVDCWSESCDWTMAGGQHAARRKTVTLPIVGESSDTSPDDDSSPDLFLITLLEEAKERGKHALGGTVKCAFNVLCGSGSSALHLADHLGPTTHSLDIHTFQLADDFDHICRLCQPWYEFAPQVDVSGLRLHPNTLAALSLTEPFPVHPVGPLCVRLYTDGSAFADKAAWALATAAECQVGFTFCASLARSLTVHARSPLASAKLLMRWKLHRWEIVGLSYGFCSGCCLRKVSAVTKSRLTTNQLDLEQQDYLSLLVARRLPECREA